MKKSVSTIVIMLFVFNLSTLKAKAQAMDSSSLHYKLNLNVPVDEAWDLWTTNTGVKKFFAPDCNINLTVGGPYEIFFFPLKPYGQRGTDSSIVLSYIPGKMLSVEWGVPRWFQARKQATEQFKRTYLVLIFSEGLKPNSAVIDFYHLGFGHGADWQMVMEYFDSPDGWQSIFNRLETYAESGQITNWDLLEWTRIKD